MPRTPVQRIFTDCREKPKQTSQLNNATGEFFGVDFYWPTIRRLCSDDKRKDWTLLDHVNIGSVVPCKGARLDAGGESALYFFDPRGEALTPFTNLNDGRPDPVHHDDKVDPNHLQTSLSQGE